MLIPSHRHTAADLRLWREHEIADRMHGMTLNRKVEQSLRTIRDFAKQRSYAAVSWGKDSVVLAHMVAICGYDIPLVWFRIEPIKNPDCVAVRDKFLSQWTCNYHEIERWCERSGNEWHATGTLESAAAEAEDLFGKRRMLGIRADESGIRKMTCLTNGVASASSCRPLAWWTAQDVMGYLAEYDLPVHPAYAMLGGGRYDRWQLRVSSLGGRRGDQFGRADWEREYYGDVLNRLAAHSFPQ